MWEHDGIICTGETYKAAVKLTFAKGASLEDPSGLFNSSLEGNTRRAIDIHEGDKINEKALKALIRAAVALNTSKPDSDAPRDPKKCPAIARRASCSRNAVASAYFFSIGQALFSSGMKASSAGMVATSL